MMGFRYLLVLMLVSVMSLPAAGQDIWMTKTGDISFYSSTPIEDIEAENNAVTCIFKPGSGELAFKVLMQSFKFARAAMQDHFNHEYLHTDEFPKATFSGTLTDYSPLDPATDGKFEVVVSGELTIHGVANTITAPGTIEVAGGAMDLHSVFVIHLPDYNVKVPANFVKNISKDIEITVKASLKPYER